jgi:DNA-directed RNA polymerase subunit RPC12/RpoP
MNYGRLARVKKDVCCPYCDSKDVHPIGRPAGTTWTWQCNTCNEKAFFKFIFDGAKDIRGVALFKIFKLENYSGNRNT